MPITAANQYAPRIFKRREIDLLAGFEINRDDVVVLVATEVPKIKQVSVVVCPVVLTGTPLFIGSDGHSRFDIFDGRNPDILYTIKRSDIADPGSVRADASLCEVGIIEEGLPGNQLEIFERQYARRVGRFHRLVRTAAGKA